MCIAGIWFHSAFLKDHAIPPVVTPELITQYNIIRILKGRFYILLANIIPFSFSAALPRQCWSVMLSYVTPFLGALKRQCQHLGDRGEKWRVLLGSSKRLLSSERFTVRRLQTADEVATLTSKAAELGRKPGALDHVSYFAADNSGFYVGELNGQVICCISAVKYSDKYAFFGHYIVDEPYRGKGYGQLLLNTVIASLPKGCNLAADVIEESVPWYERTYGVVRAWRNQHVTLTAAQGLQALSRVRTPFVIIRPTYEVQFNRVVEYDTSVHAYPRESFLEKWISAPNCYSFAATDSDGTVVGYTVVRTILDPDDGWKVGPLFADDTQIARSLCKTVFEKVAAEDRPSANIIISVPFGGVSNPDALQVAKEVSARLERTTARVYTHRVPSELQLQKMFALTSSGL